MRILGFAFDYDGTLATDGEVGPRTLEALRRLKGGGRKLIMVTGRELPDLARVFAHLGLFDAVVAENGALLHHPSGETRPLAARPPEAFLEALRRKGVQPLNIGSSIVATSRDQAEPLLDVLAALGLDWAPIFNKSSLMCLPPGVDKASGLAVALEALGLEARSVVGVGDAENDHTFLAECGLSIAVANALPELKEAVDVVADQEAGEAIVWLADELSSAGPEGLLARARPGRRRRGDLAADLAAPPAI